MSRGKSQSYDEFLKKFEPKKTTDDCLTPSYIYDVVSAWVLKTYDVKPNGIMRPFWPNGDYKREHYADGCLVLDNPPFSIISEVCKWYSERGIDFFLFAPGLVLFGGEKGDAVNYVISDNQITYANGAKVPTSFVTTLGDMFIRTAPDLHAAIKQAEKEQPSKTMPS